MKSARNEIRSLIGNTPLLRLGSSDPGSGPEILLKLEHLNPGGSIKDRTALGLFRQAESDGVLETSTSIVESSSGNTAIGLATLSKLRGNTIVAVCDRHLPAAKRARLLALGAEVVFLPATPPGMDTVKLRIRIAAELARALPDAVHLDQYANPANPAIHYETTGPEIWTATERRISVLVAAVGTCGTISGVGRFLKERRPQIRVVGVEPQGSVIFGGDPGRYRVQGGGLSFKPANLDETVIDLGLKVSDADAFESARQVARDQGILLGGTGGLVVAAIDRIALDFGPDDVIVGVIPDSGERYLDSLYDPAWLDAVVKRRGQGTSAGDLQVATDNLGCSLNDYSATAEASFGELCSQLGVDGEVLLG